MTELEILHLAEQPPPSVQPGDVTEADAVQGFTTESISPSRQAWRRYWRHRAAAVCTIIMGLLILTVVFSGITARYGVNEQVIKIQEGKNQYLSPRKLAWFGTDETGYDIYSRLIYGLRVSLFIGMASALISVVVGTLVGSVAGLYGGRFDDALMRVTDIFLAFPALVALIVVRNLLGNIGWVTAIIGDKSSIRFLIFLFAIFGWMGVARLVRGQVLALKEREFIEASRAVGASSRRIIVRHLLPNSIGPILVSLTISVVAAIVGESTLSFFGFGPQPGAGQTSLGNLVSLAKGAVFSGYWWLVAFPSGLLVLVALCVSFIGDGLRDALDPKLDNSK